MDAARLESPAEPENLETDQTYPPPLVPPKEFDVRFKDPNAMSLYNEYQGRKIIPDKGFTESQATHEFVKDIIAKRNWSFFVKHPSTRSSWELVREFYANIDIEGDVSVVRGIHVPYAADTINRVLQIPNSDPIPEFWSQLEGGKDKKNRKDLVKEKQLVEFRKKVCLDLCPEGTAEWLPNTKGTLVMRSMDKRYVPWWHLWSFKVYPHDHRNEGSATHLYPIYCIAKDLPINVGELINHKIKGCKKARIFHFPYLIKQLCEDANVPLTEFALDYDLGNSVAFTRKKRPSKRQEHPLTVTHVSTRTGRSRKRTEHQLMDEHIRTKKKSSTKQIEHPAAQMAMQTPGEVTATHEDGFLLTRLEDIAKKQEQQDRTIQMLNARIDEQGETIKMQDATIQLMKSKLDEQDVFLKTLGTL